MKSRTHPVKQEAGSLIDCSRSPDDGVTDAGYGGKDAVVDEQEEGFDEISGGAHEG